MFVREERDRIVSTFPAQVIESRNLNLSSWNMSDWQCHGRLSSGRCPCALCRPTYISTNPSSSAALQSVRSPMPMLPGAQAPFLSSPSTYDLWYRSSLLANSTQHTLGKDLSNCGHYRPSPLDRRFSYHSTSESLQQNFPQSTMSSLQLHAGKRGFVILKLSLTHYQRSFFISD